MSNKLVIRFNSPAVLTFALLSLGALLLDGLTGGFTTSELFCVYRASLADPFTYVRFFGHVLGHSGYEHYMGNMLLLLLVNCMYIHKQPLLHHNQLLLMLLPL